VHRFVRDIPYNESIPSYKTMQSIERGLTQFRDRPMMICWGMQDFCFTPKFLDEWWSRFPSAQIHRFDDAGHYVVEDAWERILPLLLSFTGAHAPQHSA
jgi:haloalkane dehalogenase